MASAPVSQYEARDEDTQITGSNSPFPFRELAKETQLEIFKYCWPSVQRSGKPFGKTTVTSILLANKAIYTDFAPHWYRHAIFTIGYSQLPSMLAGAGFESLSPLCRYNIKNIEVSFRDEIDEFPRCYSQKVQKEFTQACHNIVQDLLSHPRLSETPGVRLSFVFDEPRYAGFNMNTPLDSVTNGVWWLDNMQNRTSLTPTKANPTKWMDKYNITRYGFLQTKEDSEDGQQEEVEITEGTAPEAKIIVSDIKKLVMDFSRKANPRRSNRLTAKAAKIKIREYAGIAAGEDE